jgi:mRNA interferase MazF
MTGFMMDDHDDLTHGDVVLVDFRPARGHEQDGMRPALVMTDSGYNSASSYCVVCPITSNARPWPFKVPLPDGLKVRGFVMLDQIKSIDRRRRIIRWIDHVPDETMLDYRHRLATLLKLPVLRGQ